MGREKRGAVKLPFVPLSFERWLQRRGELQIDKNGRGKRKGKRRDVNICEGEVQEKEGKGWISEKEEEDANMETTIDIVHIKTFFIRGMQNGCRKED